MTDEELKNFYPKSHYSMMGHSAEPAKEPPPREEMDQLVYDDLIARGFTEAHARSEAEHSSFVARVYAGSRIGPTPELPPEEPPEPKPPAGEPPEEMDQSVFDDLISKGHTEEEAKEEAEHAAWLSRARGESRPAPAAKPPDDRDYSKIYPKSQ